MHVIESWLMLYRNAKKNDVNHGKWIGVGGKVEENETIDACMKREIKEETGLTANSLQHRGILYFTYDTKEEEKIYVYSCNDFSGELMDCDEGKLAFIAKDQILNLSLWEGDRIFLKKMLNNEKDEFIYRLRYDRNDNLIEVEDLEELG